MTRKYKKNRARGTRTSTYNKKDYEFSGFKVRGRRGKITDKQLIHEEYLRNQKRFDTYYENKLTRLAADERQDFQSTYNTAEDYWTKRIHGYSKRNKISAYKAIKFAIEKEFGEVEYRHKKNLESGIESAGLMNDLKTIIMQEGDSYDVSRLQYVGDATYIYELTNGKKIKFLVKSSPVQLVLLNNKGQEEAWSK